MADLTTLANVKQWLGLYPDKLITAITRANPGVVSCALHGLQNGMQIKPYGVTGMTSLNDEILTVAVIDADSFSIGIDTSGFPAYAGGGMFGLDDVLLSRLIASVSAFCTSYCNRSFLRDQYKKNLTLTRGCALTLDNWPIVSVDLLVVNGETIPESVDGSDGFSFDDLNVYLKGYRFGGSVSDGFPNVSITYTAGYQTVPYDLEQSVINTVALRYREKERVGQRSKVLAGETTSYLVVDIPLDVKLVWDQYRRIVLL